MPGNIPFVREENTPETAIQLWVEEAEANRRYLSIPGNLMKFSQLRKPWFEYWFAAHVCVRLCWVSILLRFRTLPELLEQLSLREGHRDRKTHPTFDRAVQIIVRVCHLRPFRGPLFPRTCLRQALTLFSILPHLGYDVTIHFGITKSGEQLRGHSWVTLEGKPLAENGNPGASHQILYSYPSSQPGSTQDVPEIFESNAKLF